MILIELERKKYMSDLVKGTRETCDDGTWRSQLSLAQYSYAKSQVLCTAGTSSNKYVGTRVIVIVMVLYYGLMFYRYPSHAMDSTCTIPSIIVPPHY